MKKLFLLLWVCVAILGNAWQAHAQQIPACLQGLNKGGESEPRRSYESTLKLKDGRTVYAVSLKRPPKCMDCASGVYYVDSTCRTVASFTIGFAPIASVNDDYAATDFPESRSAIFGNRLKKRDPLPSCIASAITRTDSLKKAGISRVQEVLIADHRLYQFQPKPADVKNCADCATMITYYDSTCRQVGTFSIGGIAGILAPPGFTKQDYIDKKLLRVLWTNDSIIPQPLSPAAAAALNPFPKPVAFTITAVYDTLVKKFMTSDVLKISMADGLSHSRKGKLINQYKIIPQKITQEIRSGCLHPPCNPRTSDKVVFWLEPAKRYFYINMSGKEGRLLVSKEHFAASDAKTFFREDEWINAYKLKY